MRKVLIPETVLPSSDDSDDGEGELSKHNGSTHSKKSDSNSSSDDEGTMLN